MCLAVQSGTLSDHCLIWPGSSPTLTIDFNFFSVHFISNCISFLSYSIYYFSSACGYEQIKYQLSIFIFSFVKWAILLDNCVILILAVPHNISLEDLQERIYRCVTASEECQYLDERWYLFQDVIFHNEAYSQSSSADSSAESSPEHQPSAAAGFVSAVLNAIRTATSSRLTNTGSTN